MLWKFILTWLQLYVIELILTKISSYKQVVNSYEFFANGYYNQKNFIIPANLSVTLSQCANLCIGEFFKFKIRKMHFKITRRCLFPI